VEKIQINNKENEAKEKVLTQEEERRLRCKILVKIKRKIKSLKKNYIQSPLSTANLDIANNTI
jgi:hypothetical protein